MPVELTGALSAPPTGSGEPTIPTPGATPAPPPAWPAGRDLIRHTLFGSPAAPEAPAPAAEAPPATTPAPEPDPARAAAPPSPPASPLASAWEDYARRHGWDAAPATPATQAAPAATDPATPPPVVAPAPAGFDFDALDPDEFGTTDEVLLATALKAAVAEIRELKGQVDPIRSHVETTAAAERERAGEEAIRVMGEGARLIQERHGVTVTPEQAGRLTMQFAQALTGRYADLVPEAVLSAFELANHDHIVQQARLQAAPAAPPAPAPPDLAPNGAAAKEVPLNRLSVRQQIQANLRGQFGG